MSATPDNCFHLTVDLVREIHTEAIVNFGGSYQGFPWHTSVRAFWEFDSSNRLAGVRIQRIKDSP